MIALERVYVYAVKTSKVFPNLSRKIVNTLEQYLVALSDFFSLVAK